jgi:mRNA interferase RelE/StbE
MAYRLETSPAAQRQWLKLPGEVQRTLAPRIDALADDPRARRCKKLSGQAVYRLRVGDYRIVYGIDDSEQIITITKIAKRDTVYR